MLQAFARRLGCEPATAADLIQDTLERAWRNLDALQDDGRAGAWMTRILRNAWIDQLRRRRTEVPLEDTDEQWLAVDEPPRWERITMAELRSVIEQVIEQLDEPYRSVALHDLDGLSYREIARFFDIPDATAATRLHRAHAQIRTILRRQRKADGIARPAAARTPASHECEMCNRS